MASQEVTPENTVRSSAVTFTRVHGSVSISSTKRLVNLVSVYTLYITRPVHNSFFTSNTLYYLSEHTKLVFKVFNNWNLSSLVRKIRYVPATSVISERVFSVARATVKRIHEASNQSLVLENSATLNSASVRENRTCE